MLSNVTGAMFVLWLVRAVVVLYCLWLATRLVQAVEGIALRMDRPTS
jgi:hypothetical protein